MEVTQELVHEHQIILLINHKMNLARQVSYHFEANRYFQIVERYIEFIESFVDDFHHLKEEEVLFEALSLPGTTFDISGLTRMLYEHEIARDALEMISAGYENARIELIDYGIKSYQHILHGHIRHEDQTLFPAAEQLLADNVKARINNFYRDIDAVKGREILWLKQTNLLFDIEELIKASEINFH